MSLWLPPALAAALAVAGRTRTRLRAELDARRLEVVTLSGASFDEDNGSPSDGGGGECPPATSADGGSGGPEKDEDGDGGEPAGTQPGWDEPARREYTLDLARILVDLLPEDAVRGTVGTIGLGCQAGWDDDAEKASTGLVRRLSAGLADLAWQNGRAVRVGFEPAGGYVLDSPEETVAALTRIDKDRLGVRLDLDHVTRAWSDPAAGIETVTDAGLSIVEVRLTAAPGPAIDAWRAALAQLLGPDGPQTEFLTLAGHVPDPSAEQIVSDLAYLTRELADLGLAPENEPCAAR